MSQQIIVSILVGVIYFLKIFSYLIIINSLLSWFMDPSHPIRNLLGQLINPIVDPFRKITDRFTSTGFPVDLAPLFAFFTIMIVTQILQTILTKI